MDNIDKIRILPTEWVVDYLRGRLDPPIRIQASHAAIEEFRGQAMANDNPWCRMIMAVIPWDNGIGFQIEQNPYRHNGKELIFPYVEILGSDGVSMAPKINPEWVNAGYELVVGYGVGGMQIVTIKRHEPRN